MKPARPAVDLGRAFAALEEAERVAGLIVSARPVLEALRDGRRELDGLHGRLATLKAEVGKADGEVVEARARTQRVIGTEREKTHRELRKLGDQQKAADQRCRAAEESARQAEGRVAAIDQRATADEARRKQALEGELREIRTRETDKIADAKQRLASLEAKITEAEQRLRALEQAHRALREQAALVAQGGG